MGAWRSYQNKLRLLRFARNDNSFLANLGRSDRLTSDEAGGIRKPRTDEGEELTRKERASGMFLQFSLEHLVKIERIILEQGLDEVAE